MFTIPNHHGVGLRKDEIPFAKKIPPGGNWKSLSIDDQLVFWKGKIPTDGGCTNGLRRRNWDEPAGTITTAPIQKLSCQLHPADGYDDNDIEGREYVNYNVTPTLPSNGYTIAELFAGGGLMTVGLKESGFSIVWANEIDKSAAKTYAHNFGDHIVLGDITKIDPNEIPDVDVIAGGPPCQDYSVAGKGEGAEGERGKLVFTYLNIIEKKQPKAFIFENVKGLITKRHRPTFDALLEKFNEIGYEVSWQLINAWDYGVAQKRERVFIVGIRKDLGFSFKFPEPDPKDYRTQVLRDVIGDLPEPSEYYYRHPYRYGRQAVFGIDEPAPTVRTVNRPMPSGYPGHPNDANVKNQSEGNGTEAVKPRRFTVRECLRIQSVPDWYVIPEDISLSAAYRIVGNGVASKVAWYLGRALAKQLREAEELYYEADLSA